MNRLLITGGRIVTAVDDYEGDVLIEGDKISAIFGSRANIDAKTIDASGKLVIPGGIDVHTHLDMPFGGATSADDFESGTIAAAHGGTTSIVDFAIQYKGQALRTARDAWAKKAEGRAAID
jgi:dihydropyrimidinase